MKKMSLIPDAQTEYIDSKGATAVIWGKPLKDGAMITFQYVNDEDRGIFHKVTPSQFRQMFKLKERVVK